ncbi:carbohydrate ABC transporter permease [Jiangella alkaliphila]|uniref:Carbohydrate ABC transporter membrane protein 1, CUT1 family n=1 Tax=Jiangella alkaliphila TaxID=419479 RepID=A0A1H2LQT0_9ACTN|nr:sugar ABC transporter permease [Jiangella alkaliphila]SDU83363.1 carbohydrate ABC transporter membrane protein 1, CUT1 family [Jiangella alkaliphila]
MVSPTATAPARGPAARGPAGRSSPTRIRRHAPWTPYAFMAPFLVIFVTFVLAPAVLGIWMSLHDWDFMLPNRPFVGLDNYAALFDSTSAVFETFWHGMRATAIFTVASVPLLVAIPLGLAIMLNRRFPGRTVFRAIFFMPYVLGVAVVGLLFRFMLDPNIGIVNGLLGTSTPWITAQPWAWISLVAMTVWWTLGFNTIIYLAGLQDIPGELYDAARVDGASAWQQFRHVTLPGLRTVHLFVVTITILASANMFGQALLVTNGGPGDTTRTALIVMLAEGLESFRMGSAAAMSYLLAVFLGIVSIVQVLAMRERRPRWRS